ncbi:MAG: DUF5719 family protein, partial [Propionibacteriaceae bacterium]|nr:DUF5719 family protein [Propionibacteriaceae bacterium]
MRRRWIGLLGLLLLGLVIVAGVLWPWPTLPAPEKIDVPVTRLLVCPVGDPALGKTQVRVTDQEPFVAGVLGEVAGEPSIAVDLENPAKPVVVKGSSSVVGLSTYTESNLSMTAPCAAPVTSGTWSAVPVDDASASTLIMTNVDQASGVIDIFLYDQSGQLAVPGLSDIPVAGGQTVTLAIDHLVDSANPVAVVMRASKGRVAAVLRTIGSGGAQWVMPQRTADQDLVISGIPAGSGGRSLVLTNTSQTAPATVEVEVMSTEGSFAPMG